MTKQAKKIGRNSSKRIRPLAAIGVIAAIFVVGATAAISLRTSEAKNPTPRRNEVPLANNARANMNIRPGFQQLPLDQQTGQIRPLTQEEAQKLAEGIKQLVNQSTDGLVPVHHADGSVSMDLQGRFQSIAVAKKTEDGKFTESCVDNPTSAAAFFGIDPQLVGGQRNAASLTEVPQKRSDQ